MTIDELLHNTHATISLLRTSIYLRHNKHDMQDILDLLLLSLYILFFKNLLQINLRLIKESFFQL